MREGHKLTSDLVQEVVELVTAKQMIGTSFDLNPFVEQKTDFECVMYVDPDYDGEEIKNDVLDYLDEVVFSYGVLQFEDTIVKSDIENEVKNVFDGILSFRINTPIDDIISPTSPENVITKGTVNIEVKYL